LVADGAPEMLSVGGGSVRLGGAELHEHCPLQENKPQGANFRIARVEQFGETVEQGFGGEATTRPAIQHHLENTNNTLEFSRHM